MSTLISANVLLFSRLVGIYLRIYALTLEAILLRTQYDKQLIGEGMERLVSDWQELCRAYPNEQLCEQGLAWVALDNSGK